MKSVRDLIFVVAVAGNFTLCAALSAQYVVVKGTTSRIGSNKSADYFIATSKSSNTHSIIYRNGAAQALPTSVSEPTVVEAPGAFDGVPDLLSISNGSPLLSFGAETGAVSPPKAFGSALSIAEGEKSSAITGDFDGDGTLDLVIIASGKIVENYYSENGYKVYTYLPQQTVMKLYSSRYGERTSVVSGGLSNPVVGDLNGDGFLDIVLTRDGGFTSFTPTNLERAGSLTAPTSVVLLSNLRNGTFSENTLIKRETESASISWAKVIDLNGDGFFDILHNWDLADGMDRHCGVRWLLNDTRGNFIPSTDEQSLSFDGPLCRKAIITDLDRDGRDDIGIALEEPVKPEGEPYSLAYHLLYLKAVPTQAGVAFQGLCVSSLQLPDFHTISILDATDDGIPDLVLPEVGAIVGCSGATKESGFVIPFSQSPLAVIPQGITSIRRVSVGAISGAKVQIGSRVAVSDAQGDFSLPVVSQGATAIGATHAHYAFTSVTKNITSGDREIALYGQKIEQPVATPTPGVAAPTTPVNPGNIESGVSTPAPSLENSYRKKDFLLYVSTTPYVAAAAQCSFELSIAAPKGAFQKLITVPYGKAVLIAKNLPGFKRLKDSRVQIAARTKCGEQYVSEATILKLSTVSPGGTKVSAAQWVAQLKKKLRVRK